MFNILLLRLDLPAFFGYRWIQIFILKYKMIKKSFMSIQTHSFSNTDDEKHLLQAFKHSSSSALWLSGEWQIQLHKTVGLILNLCHKTHSTRKYVTSGHKAGFMRRQPSPENHLLLTNTKHIYCSEIWNKVPHILLSNIKATFRLKLWDFGSDDRLWRLAGHSG